jgi:hypothetical protein
LAENKTSSLLLRLTPDVLPWATKKKQCIAIRLSIPSPFTVSSLATQREP